MSKEKKMNAKEVPFNPSEKIIAIQSEICGLKKNTNNPFFKSKYINLGSIVNAIKPVLHKNDCYSTHKVNINGEGNPFLVTEIAYKDGTVLLSCASPLPVKDGNDPQKLGSAITYMRRYNLTALLEIEEDDDDGNSANQPSTKQNQFQKLGNATNGDMEATQRKANEDRFAKLKESLEGCGSLDEMVALWQDSMKVVGQLKKYANKDNNDLYSKLIDCKQYMKNALDPDGQEA